jgi:hypothetical protein
LWLVFRGLSPTLDPEKTKARLRGWLKVYIPPSQKRDEWGTRAVLMGLNKGQATATTKAKANAGVLRSAQNDNIRMTTFS